jgi:hypothetical protein
VQSLEKGKSARRALALSRDYNIHYPSCFRIDLIGRWLCARALSTTLASPEASNSLPSRSRYYQRWLQPSMAQSIISRQFPQPSLLAGGSQRMML